VYRLQVCRSSTGVKQCRSNTGVQGCTNGIKCLLICVNEQYSSIEA
jgi:hypothetical protein